MSERTVDYETHVDLVAEHAATEYRLQLTRRAVQALEIDAEALRDDLCETIGSLAEANSVCDRQSGEITDLKADLKSAEEVAKELAESNERLLERAERAERRLRQAQSGETDEEVAMLRARLEAASRKLEDQEEATSRAVRQAAELRDRAQKAEAELATVKLQHAKDHTAMCGYREANGQMSRQIAELEKVIDGLRAEVSHSTMEAPDAVA